LLCGRHPLHRGQRLGITQLARLGQWRVRIEEGRDQTGIAPARNDRAFGAAAQAVLLRPAAMIDQEAGIGVEPQAVGLAQPLPLDDRAACGWVDAICRA
jgi:hypothetical protein